MMLACIMICMLLPKGDVHAADSFPFFILCLHFSVCRGTPVDICLFLYNSPALGHIFIYRYKHFLFECFVILSMDRQSQHSGDFYHFVNASGNTYIDNNNTGFIRKSDVHIPVISITVAEIFIPFSGSDTLVNIGCAFCTGCAFIHAFIYRYHAFCPAGQFH